MSTTGLARGSRVDVFVTPKSSTTSDAAATPTKKVLASAAVAAVMTSSGGFGSGSMTSVQIYVPADKVAAPRRGGGRRGQADPRARPSEPSPAAEHDRGPDRPQPPVGVGGRDDARGPARRDGEPSVCRRVRAALGGRGRPRRHRRRLLRPARARPGGREPPARQSDPRHRGPPRRRRGRRAPAAPARRRRPPFRSMRAPTGGQQAARGRCRRHRRRARGVARLQAADGAAVAPGAEPRHGAARTPRRGEPPGEVPGGVLRVPSGRLETSDEPRDAGGPAGDGERPRVAALPRGRAPSVRPSSRCGGPPGAPGRTTVATTLAAEIAGRGVEVLLVDADTYGGCVAQTLGLLDEAPGIAAACRAADQGLLDLPALVAHRARGRPRPAGADRAAQGRALARGARGRPRAGPRAEPARSCRSSSSTAASASRTTRS